LLSLKQLETERLGKKKKRSVSSCVSDSRQEQPTGAAWRQEEN
jgi:hypothetical protein